ncbi:hypothetical protein Ddye_001467 [Dipteronia dyeriana]|uniref:RNase H type-1 domain-containing protein n=1 Tax=Dipteronia dyeriana TaxID=168575 RepID=A0AAE0CU09_9ROSI|nr:hypothetical protein Ddye_001467 [Dipteronia dyeriana]
MASGLRINFHKSCVVKVGKKWQMEEDWVMAFRCKKATLPITYLGMPLGGIGRIVNKNNGMLAKWVWRYKKDKDLLWRKVICSKYGEDPQGIRCSGNTGSNVSSFVKVVSSLFKEESQSRRILDEALKDRFPRIFALAVKKVGVINTFGGWLVDRWIEKVQLHRRVFDLEREEWFQGWNGLCPNVKFRRVWVTLFSATAWSIWEARNQAMFKGNPVNITYYVDLVRFRVAWWFNHHGKGLSEPISIILENLKTCCAEVKKIQTSGNKVWVPPKKADLSFNVDGSDRRIFGKAGIRGVLRNSKGEILCSFFAPVSSLDVNMVELMAIHKACVICVSNPVFVGKKIIISSDSSTAVSWVIDNDFGNLCLWDLIADIRSMLFYLDNTTVKHCSRDLNNMADRLAKHGIALSGEIIVWGV